jgi:hypothetical protein
MYERVPVRDVPEDPEHPLAEHDDSPLLASDVDQRQETKRYSTSWWLVTLVLVAAAAALVSGTVGFTWGRRVERDHAESDWFCTFTFWQNPH